MKVANESAQVASHDRSHISLHIRECRAGPEFICFPRTPTLVGGHTLPPIHMEPDIRGSWKTIFLLKGPPVRLHVKRWKERPASA